MKTEKEGKCEKCVGGNENERKNGRKNENE